MTNDFNMPVTPHRLELMDRAHLTVSGVEYHSYRLLLRNNRA